MKKYLPYLLLLVLAGVFLGYKLWNKPHEDMLLANSDIAFEATKLFSEFDTDELTANTAYLDKVILITGTVVSSSKDDNGQVKIMLESGDPMFGVICELDTHSSHKRTDFTPGESITLKGKCTGKLMDVVLVRCVEI
ncbi:MAG: hypothetical protein R2795_06830 [Saprospiraceae bacterium]